MDTTMFQKAVAAVNGVLKISLKDTSTRLHLRITWQISQGPFTVWVYSPGPEAKYGYNQFVSLDFARNPKGSFDRKAAEPIVCQLVAAFLQAFPKEEERQIWCNGEQMTTAGVLYALENYPENAV